LKSPRQKTSLQAEGKLELGEHKGKGFNAMRLGLKTILLTLLLAGVLAREIQAEPIFRVFYEGFEDTNGNGITDCGETFDLKILLSDDGPIVSPPLISTGTITLPTDTTSVFWDYNPGSLLLDSSLTKNCVITSILEGNQSSDDQAIFRYQCGGPPYVLSVLAKGTYVGLEGPFKVFTEDLLDTGVVLTDSLERSDVASCLPIDVALSKNDGGVSVLPGQTVSYTLSYLNLAGPAAGATLHETVPANTVFDAASSSPGWSCSSTAPGTACTLVLGDLPRGASGTRFFAVTVRPDALVSSISNTATVSIAAEDADTTNNSASDTTPINPGTPDLTLSKTVTTSSAMAGSTVVFRLTVQNIGDGPAVASRVLDSVPPHTSFNATVSSPGWSCSGSSCTFDLGTLIAGATRTIDFAVDVARPLPATYGSLENTACASTTDPDDPPANNCGSASTPLDASPSLSLIKALQSGSGMPGSTLVFRLTATNSGDRDSGAVTFTEVIPAHTRFDDSASSPGWSCSPNDGAGSSCSKTTAGIPGAGGTTIVQFAVTIGNPLPAGVARVSNTACVSTTGSEDCDSIDVPTDGRPMVTVMKRVSAGAPIPGEILTFTVTAQNTGNQGSPAVTLVEQVPVHTVFAPSSSSPGWSCTSSAAGGTCSLAVGSIPGGGASTSRTFAVRIDNPLPATATEIRNVACTRSGSAPEVCDEVSVPPQANPTLTISKVVAQGSAEPGQVLLYRITIANDGNQHAGTVQVTDQLPSHTSYSPAGSSPGWTCAPAGLCTTSLDSLPAGTRTSLLLAIRIADRVPADLLTLTNSACATDAPARNVCATVDTPLGGAPVLRLVKTYTGGPLRPGAALPFTLTVTNDGNRDAKAVRLREIVPTGASFVPASSDPRWQCAGTGEGSACLLELPTLEAGATVTVQVGLMAENPLPAGVRQISNSACASADQSGSTSCDDVSTPMTIRVEATLVDSLLSDPNGNGLLDDGEELHYELVVQNTSDQPASNLLVTTTLDPHLALIAGSVTTAAGTVVSGNSPGDPSPEVFIPSLAPGASVTIQFDVKSLDPVASGLSSVASQGLVTGPDIEAEPTDDPDTEPDDDPTATALGDNGGPPPGGLHEIPTVGEYGLIALALLLAAVALPRLRVRSAMSSLR
jgi:large repetitive protein